MKNKLLFSILFLSAIIAKSQSPIPQINVVGYASANPVVTGMAPYTVHTSALNSTLFNGTDTKAMYEWNFGDNSTSAVYNTLDGWTAAHVYDEPGTYTVTLKITDQNYEVAEQAITVTVTPDIRQQVYVSATNGNDSNNGLSASTPKRSLKAANELVTNNTALNIMRGDTFVTDSFQIYLANLNNVVVRAYGTGAKPVLSNGTEYSESNPAHILISRCANVIIQDLEFTSPLEPRYFTPFSTPSNGIYCTDSMSQELTIRNSIFDNVGFSISTWNIVGLLILNNYADMVGKYLFYGQAQQGSIIGNTCRGTTDGICVRTYHGPFNISHNTLWTDHEELARQPGEGVASSFPVSIVIGHHFYVAKNVTHGAWMVGYVTQFGLSSVQNVVIDGNVMNRNSHFDPTIRLFPNDDNIMIRNNVFHHTDTAINTEGIRFEEPGAGLPGETATIGTVWVYNNTFVSSVDVTTFLNFACSPIVGDSFHVANNLVVYPTLFGGSRFSWDPYMITTQQPLDRVTFDYNLWQAPVGGDPFRINGDRIPISQWNTTYPTDSFNLATGTDLNYFLANNYKLQANSASNRFCNPVKGVHKDRLGNWRPQLSKTTAGAFELSPDTTIILGITSQKEQNPFAVKVYPNPVIDNIVNLELPEKVVVVSVFDIASNQVDATLNLQGNNVKIDVSNLPSGVYFLKVNTENSFYTVKILKM